MKKNATTAPKPDRAAEALDALLMRFETGTIADTIARYVLADDIDKPCKDWSLSNNVILWSQDTADARGYKQWKEAGRQVKKGAHALYILAPNTRRIDDDDNPGEKKTIVLGFRGIPVFAIEDTEGEPIAALAPPTPPPLAEVAAAWNIQINYAEFRGRALGSYIPSRDFITLSTHDPSVFLHELSHAAHDRLGLLSGVKKDDTARIEAVADLSATVLCQLYGIGDYSGNAYKYLENYAEEGKAGRLAVKVAGETAEVIRLIVETAEGALDNREAAA